MACGGDGVHFQDGHIEVPQAKVHFDLDHDFRHLGKDDARRVLEAYRAMRRTTACSA